MYTHTHTPVLSVFCQMKISSQYAATKACVELGPHGDLNIKTRFFVFSISPFRVGSTILLAFTSQVVRGFNICMNLFRHRTVRQIQLQIRGDRARTTFLTTAMQCIPSL